MYFLDKKINEIKEAFSLKIENGQLLIQFTPGGKVYKYNEERIEIKKDKEQKTKELLVYIFEQVCYKCGKSTKILTYIVYDDQIENLVYPWDKNRLNNQKTMETVITHMKYPEIEFYPIKIIGGDEKLDEILLEKYPYQIHMKYSSTQKRKYPMNVCQHCNAKQGEFFIYKKINQKIQRMENIEIYDRIILSK